MPPGLNLLFAKLFPGAVLRFAARLRFPQLFLLVLALFALNVLIPDGLPFLDELLLGLLTLLLASLRRRP